MNSLDQKRCARTARVLSVETRVRIVCLLKGRALCVRALARRLGITEGAVSQHLRVMRDAELVLGEKRGLFVHYRLNADTLSRWRGEMTRLLDPAGGSGAEAEGAAGCAAPGPRGGGRS